MKIVTIIGARPQFIKAAAVSRAIRDYNASSSDPVKEIIIHTGQHFDKNMSDVFFTELDIPRPDYNLEISSLSHGAMTGRMLEEIEKLLIEENPDLVLIYGDTNSTLAGALAASKLHIKVAHVEAGLRSFNMKMPEEINRILSDRVSTALYCPTEEAIKNLRNEGVTEGVSLVGDVMYDVTLYYNDKARESVTLNKWKLSDKQYVLCTIHRAENTDDPERLKSILQALKEINESETVVLPIHPRTKNIIANLEGDDWLAGIKVIDPVPYLEMLRLEMSARLILTDSGGVQKEAYFNQVPCVTMRDETEWVETVELGWNKIVGADHEKILYAYHNLDHVERQQGLFPYGKGNAAQLILSSILEI